MRRREFIVGQSALITACTNDDIAAPRPVVRPVEEKKKPKPKPAEEPAVVAPHDHSHHHDADQSPEHALLDVAGDCVQKGQICQAHCYILLGQGDTSMIACTKAVTDMIAVNQALAALAAAPSPLLRAQAAVAREACGRCQEACQVHADKHPTCRDCAEACGNSLAALAKYLG